MRNLIRTIINYMMLFTLCSCADKACEIWPMASAESEVTDTEFIETNIENVLLRQVLHGYQCEAMYDSTEYTLGEDDILALGDVFAEEMSNMGLELDSKLFVERVLSTHGVDASKPCYFSLTEQRMEMYMVQGLYKAEPKYDFKINLSKSRSHRIEEVVFDSRVGLMYPVMFLPEVIDYKKKYPNIKRAERMLTMPYRNGEKVKKWSEESSVLSNHEDVMKMVYHINNYILYGNRESLDWLVKNNMQVLQAMFVDFHMEHEPIIDSLVLVRTRSGQARLEALFAERNADGSVYVREGLLDYISQNERMKAPRFQSSIKQYVAGCLGQDLYYDRTERFPQVLLDNFTLEERRMIVAHIMNMVFSLYSGAESDKIMQVIVDNDPDFINDAVKKKYYGFDNLRTGLSIYRMRFRAEHWKVLTPSH